MSTSKETTSAPTRTVETEVVTPQVTKANISGETQEASTQDEQSTSVDLDLEADPESVSEGSAEDQPEGDQPEGDAPEGDGSEEGPEPLPDYDPDNEEVRSAYEQRYFKDGVFNEDAVSAEYWASFAKAGGDVSKAGLSEGTYKFLEDTMGVSKETAKKLEKSLVAQHAADEQQFLGKFGGVKRYNDAITWAKGGGYSEEQQGRFRKAYAAGGEDREDAVEALMNRFHRANRGADNERSGRRGPPGRRQSAPQRDVTGGARTPGNGSGGAQPFKNASEHQAATVEAQKAINAAVSSGDKQAEREARAKFGEVSRRGRLRYSG